MVMLNLLLVVLGLAGLFFGGNWLVKGASRLARSFGISPLIIGLTIVALGTSMPELLVSLNAVLQNSTQISLGNIVGSNIANIGLILGLTGLTFPIRVHVGLVRREIPIMLLVSLVACLMVVDGVAGRVDGLLLLLGFVAFNVLMYRLSVRDRREGSLTDADLLEGEAAYEAYKAINRRREVVRLVAGTAILMVGARLTVDGSVEIARWVGVSELFIGLTLVAVGTSLPELATSIIAALRKESDIAVGNIVGSNIFNLLLILGVTSAVRPLDVGPEVVNFNMPIMLIFALLLLPFARNHIVSRWEAGVLLGGYVIFAVLAFVV